MAFKVLITKNEIKEINPDACKLLEDNGCELIYCSIPDTEKYIKDVDAVMIGTEPFGRDLIEKAENLKVISRYGVGYDAVDLEAASERGIIVANGPGCNAEAVADLTLLFMLLCSRDVIGANQALKEGQYFRPVGHELPKRKVGIIGTGRIGQRVVRRCLGFGMEVYANDIKEYPEFQKETGITYTDKETIYRTCDYISVHTPKDEITTNLITSKEIAMMKDGVVLVNTARGGIINEEDLKVALETGKVASAGVDVSVIEPAINNPLVNTKNCFFTPHVGASTIEANWMMGQMAAENIVEFIQTGKCTNQVN